ncbi:MAG: hypothetical protein ABI792_02025 [bacterium]
MFPALVLVIIYFVLADENISSDKATADLVFITMSLFGLAALAIGFLCNYIIGLNKKTA